MHPHTSMLRRAVAPLALLLLIQLLLAGVGGACVRQQHVATASTTAEVHHHGEHAPADPRGPDTQGSGCEMTGACAGAGVCAAPACLPARTAVTASVIPGGVLNPPALLSRAPEPPPPRG